MGPPHEGSIWRPIAPWANALTTELNLAPTLNVRLTHCESRSPWIFSRRVPWRTCRLWRAPCSAPSCRRWPTRCRASRPSWWCRPRWCRTDWTPTAACLVDCPATTQTGPSQTPDNKTQVDFYYLSWDVDMIQLKEALQ